MMSNGIQNIRNWIDNSNGLYSAIVCGSTWSCLKKVVRTNATSESSISAEKDTTGSNIKPNHLEK